MKLGFALLPLDASQQTSELRVLLWGAWYVTLHAFVKLNSLSYSTALSWSRSREFSLHHILCPVHITSSLSSGPTLNSFLGLSTTCLCISLEPANGISSTSYFLAALPVTGSRRYSRAVSKSGTRYLSVGVFWLTPLAKVVLLGRRSGCSTWFWCLNRLRWNRYAGVFRASGSQGSEEKADDVGLVGGGAAGCGVACVGVGLSGTGAAIGLGGDGGGACAGGGGFVRVFWP